MAFMLGSFTSGLFSGINEVQTAFAHNEQAKQEHIKTQQMQMQMDAAKDAKAAMDQDAAKKALGNAAAPQAVSTGQPATQSTGGAGTGAPVKSEPLPDLKSVPQPDYLNGVTTRHNTKEQMNPGTDGVTAPAQPGPNVGTPSPNEHDNTPAQPAGGSEMIGTAVPAQQHAALTATGFGGPAVSALETGKQVIAPVGNWIRNHLPGAPHTQALDTGEANVPHYLASKPATQQNPVATAQTGWNALLRPSTSSGQAVPTQPQQPSLGQQQQPLGQQILSAVSPF